MEKGERKHRIALAALCTKQDSRKKKRRRSIKYFDPDEEKMDRQGKGIHSDKKREIGRRELIEAKRKN